MPQTSLDGGDTCLSFMAATDSTATLSQLCPTYTSHLFCFCCPSVLGEHYCAQIITRAPHVSVLRPCFAAPNLTCINIPFILSLIHLNYEFRLSSDDFVYCVCSFFQGVLCQYLCKSLSMIPKLDKFKHIAYHGAICVLLVGCLLR